MIFQLLINYIHIPVIHFLDDRKEYKDTRKHCHLLELACDLKVSNRGVVVVGSIPRSEQMIFLTVSTIGMTTRLAQSGG